MSSTSASNFQGAGGRGVVKGQTVMRRHIPFIAGRGEDSHPLVIDWGSGQVGDTQVTVLGDDAQLF